MDTYNTTIKTTTELAAIYALSGWSGTNNDQCGHWQIELLFYTASPFQVKNIKYNNNKFIWLNITYTMISQNY